MRLAIVKCTINLSDAYITELTGPVLVAATPCVPKKHFNLVKPSFEGRVNTVILYVQSDQRYKTYMRGVIDFLTLNQTIPCFSSPSVKVSKRGLVC